MLVVARQQHPPCKQTLHLSASRPRLFAWCQIRQAVQNPALAIHEAEMHAWCRDVCKLVTDQVKLLRRTRQSIVGDDVDAWAMMPFAAKDRALAAELKTEGSLHAALWPHNQHTCRGHYAVCPAALDSQAYIRIHAGLRCHQVGGLVSTRA